MINKIIGVPYRYSDTISIPENFKGAEVNFRRAFTLMGEGLLFGQIYYETQLQEMYTSKENRLEFYGIIESSKMRNGIKIINIDTEEILPGEMAVTVDFEPKIIFGTEDKVCPILDDIITADKCYLNMRATDFGDVITFDLVIKVDDDIEVNSLAIY